MNETHLSIEQIIDYLHGEVAPTEDAAIRAHLLECPVCENRRADEIALTETLRDHARATERDVPPGLFARVRAETASGTPAMWERLRAAFRPAFVLPAAAAIAVAIYVGLSWRQSAAPTSIDAAYYMNEHAALAAKTPLADEVRPAMLTSDDESR
jgi:anti-sigma factor RsiW